MMKFYDHVDHMEIGNTGLVPLPDGWYKNMHTNETIDPSGRVYDKDGELVYDPFEEQEAAYDRDDYEWY